MPDETVSIIHERALLIDQIQPVHWAAGEPSGPVPEQACVMQMSAWLAGEQWTDRPACVDPQLAALLRCVNDNLPEDVLATWAPQVAPLTVGVTDASALLDRLAVRRLREGVLPLAPSWPDEVRDQVVGAVEQVIEAIESGDRDARQAAESAARSVESEAWEAHTAESDARALRSAATAAAAAWAAASIESELAAESAESASESAAWAAESAEESDELVWESVWTAEADRIFDELRRKHDDDAKGP